MSALLVHIEEQLKHPADKRSTLLRAHLDFCDGVIFPFEKVVEVFKLLYPTKSLVFNFTII